MVGDIWETLELTSYRSRTSVYKPDVTSCRPEVVYDNRETPEMTSYRSKTSVYKPEVTSCRPEVVGDNRETPEIMSFRSKSSVYLVVATRNDVITTGSDLRLREYFHDFLGNIFPYSRVIIVQYLYWPNMFLL